MKREKILLTLTKLVTLCLLTSIISLVPIGAFAESAALGDTIVMRLYVTGIPNMASMSTRVEYSADKLDLLSYEVPYGSSSCNDTKDGEFVWATIFDSSSGLDFTEKSEVLTLTFIAKQEIDDVAPLISNTTTEAYNSSLLPIDFSAITAEAEVHSENAAIESSAPPEQKFVISVYEGVGRTENDSNPEGSAASITEQATDTEKEQPSTEQAQSSTDTDIVSKLEQGVTSNGVVISYNEDDFTSVPPIKLDSANDSSGTEYAKLYRNAMIVGIVILIILAALLVVILKSHETNKNANHFANRD